MNHFDDAIVISSDEEPEHGEISFHIPTKRMGRALSARIGSPDLPSYSMSGTRPRAAESTNTIKRRRLKEAPRSTSTIDLDISERELPPQPEKFASDNVIRQHDPILLDFSRDDSMSPTRKLKQCPTAPRASQPVVHKEVCPYHFDAQYGIKMYCGPGYQQYPSALDLFGEGSEEQQICDDYDKKAQAKLLRRRSSQIRCDVFGPYVEEPVLVDEEPLWKAKDMPPTWEEDAFVVQMSEVLPDIDPEFSRKKYKLRQERYQFDDEQMCITPDPNDLVLELLDLPVYPKLSERLKIEAEPFFKETGRTITYDKVHREGREYEQQVVALLAAHFDYIPTCAIAKAFKEKKTAYDTFVYLDEADKNYHASSQKWYRRSRIPRVVLEKKYQPSLRPRDPIYYANIVNELQAAKQHIARENMKARRAQEDEEAEKLNLQECKSKGEIVECQVCYEENVPFNRAISCYAEEAHWFCYGCINSQIESLVGLMKHDLHCMDGSGCKELFPLRSLQLAVPMKILERLLSNQQQAELTAAGIDGLERCPFCDFSMICEDLEIDPNFSCQNPKCFKISCRRCREHKHFPKTCEEAKRDHGLSARHKVEEARSEAMMRICPKCKTKLIKEAGCNKMQCRCGAKMCYLCRKDLSGLKETYSHFHERFGGNACRLHDGIAGAALNPEAAIAALHDREALAAEEIAIKEAKEADSTLDDETLQIESGKGQKSSISGVQANGSRDINLQIPNRTTGHNRLRGEIFAGHDPQAGFAQILHEQVRTFNQRRAELDQMMKNVRNHGQTFAQQEHTRALQQVQKEAARQAALNQHQQHQTLRDATNEARRAAELNARMVGHQQRLLQTESAQAFARNGYSLQEDMTRMRAHESQNLTGTKFKEPINQPQIRYDEVNRINHGQVGLVAEQPLWHPLVDSVPAAPTMAAQQFPNARTFPNAFADDVPFWQPNRIHQNPFNARGGNQQQQSLDGVRMLNTVAGPYQPIHDAGLWFENSIGLYHGQPATYRPPLDNDDMNVGIPEMFEGWNWGRR